MGGLKKNAILQVGGPKNFVILRVGGIVRPPYMIVVYGGNFAGGWSKHFCNSVGSGWSEKNCDSVGEWSDISSVVTLPTNFFNGIALRGKGNLHSLKTDQFLSPERRLANHCT